MKKLRSERKHDALLDGEFRYCGVAAAMVGAAAVGAVASNSAADKSADASDRAGERSDAQYQQTRTDQLQQYQQQRDDQAPYREAALPSIANLSKGLQAGGEYGKAFGIADYMADPGYQFRLKQGEQGINRAASARGGAYSGATLKALARFNSDQASQEYGAAYSRFNNDRTTQFNRNATVAGIGQTATAATGNAGQGIYNAMASAGMQNGANQAQAAQNAGEARASGYVGVANNIGSGIKQLYNGYQQNKTLQQLQNSTASSNTYANNDWITE